MAAFNYFDQFAQDLGRGVHNLHTGSLKVMLTNVAPDAAADAVKADLTEIAAGNGYTAGGVALANVSYTQTNGIGYLTADDPQLTASGGDIAANRYWVLYNDTPTSPADPLIGWWDKGESTVISNGITATLDFPSTRIVLQI